MHTAIAKVGSTTNLGHNGYVDEGCSALRSEVAGCAALLKLSAAGGCAALLEALFDLSIQKKLSNRVGGTVAPRINGELAPACVWWAV